MSKKILFLDDMEVRHNKMRKSNIGQLVTHVYNAQAAIVALNIDVFDIASLDHDLSEESIMTMPDKGSGSGYDVALYIADMPDDKRPKHVIIHSLNPAGAERMYQALQGKTRVSRIPFR